MCKVWSEKKYTHIFIYYANLDCLGEKSFKSAKSTYTKESKLVRQVHIVEKLPPGSMIYNKNYFWEITNFVKKNNLQKKWSCICEYHIKSAHFREKSFELAKSRHFWDSKMVRQVYITSKEISVRWNLKK